MLKSPHSAIPHNLIGILLEKQNMHLLAMKHFRTACALEPTYAPSRLNLERYGKFCSSGDGIYSEEDCLENKHI